MNKYVALGLTNIRQSFIYRLEFMFSLLISPIIFGVNYFVWKAVYSGSGVERIGGLSFGQMITYYVLALLMTHFIYNTVGMQMQQKIHSGDLSTDLIKPVSIFSFFLVSSIANRVIALFLEVIPLLALAFIFLPFPMPVHPLWFLLSGALAFLLNFLIFFLVGIIAFWTVKMEAFQWLAIFVIGIFSGEFFPLSLLPGNVQTAFAFMPFEYLRYRVIEVYLGTADPVSAIIGQAAWVAILGIIVFLIWKKLLSAYAVAGG